MTATMRARINSIVRKQRSAQSLANRAKQQAAQERERKASKEDADEPMRRKLADEGAVLYQQALKAQVVDAQQVDGYGDTFVPPEGRYMRLTEEDFDTMVDALQTENPEPVLRRLGLTPLDRVYKGTLNVSSATADATGFQLDWKDVEPIIEVARVWNWPSVSALQKWVYVVQ